MIAGTKLDTVFRSLRKMGYICRANYLCCSGCAASAIAVGISDKIDAAKAQGKTLKLPKGAIFFHTQDAERIRDAHDERRGWVPGVKLNLKFGSIHTAKHGEIGKPVVQVGQDLFYALQAAGITTKWDGNEDQCVQVEIASAFAPVGT